PVANLLFRRHIRAPNTRPARQHRKSRRAVSCREHVGEATKSRLARTGTAVQRRLHPQRAVSLAPESLQAPGSQERKTRESAEATRRERICGVFRVPATATRRARPLGGGRTTRTS